MRVPRLILINGLPGSGKSALGRGNLDDHRLVLALDVDVIRSMLGRSSRSRRCRGWPPGPCSPRQTHLQAGHDVLVCQFVGKLDFVEALDQLALAGFVEVALVTGIDEATARLSDAPKTQSVRSTGTWPSFSILPEDRMPSPRCPADWRGSCGACPTTRRVVVADGDLGETYLGLLEAIHRV